jgi:predicted phosphoribosyltransferase
VLVLGLPRGGVPVAFEVSRALGAPLDVLLVRKLGLPGHEELAMGAIASGGARVVNRAVVGMSGVTDAEVEAVERREQRELARREHAYRGDRPPADVEGRLVIVVDDGLATGSTMSAAVQALRSRAPAGIVVATPVAPPETVAALRDQPGITGVVSVISPRHFGGVGAWYADFDQTSDDEVRALLARAWDGPRSRGPDPNGGDDAAKGL